jgi:hypothetical protein
VLTIEFKLKAAPGVKLESKLPSSSKRAILEHGVLPICEKLPPTTIFPSGCTTIEWTRELKKAPVLLKLPSRLPSGFNLTTPLTLVPLYLSNQPPTSIFPSGCKDKACINPFF